MQVTAGSLCIIKDIFFKLVNDKELYQNKGETRPHYLALKEKETSLEWMVPCTSNIKKWENYIAFNKAINRNYSQVEFATINGKKQILLFHKMFPILPKYIQREYFIDGNIAKIGGKGSIERLSIKVARNIRIVHDGNKLDKFSPDILGIERLMLVELGWSNEQIDIRQRFNKNKQNHLSQKQVDEQHRQTQIIDQYSPNNLQDNSFKM